MDNKKKPVVPMQQEIEELSDAQLSQVNGGLTIPTTSVNENLDGLKIPTTSGNESFSRLKLGQAVKKPTCFGKSGDRLPSDNDF